MLLLNILRETMQPRSAENKQRVLQDAMRLISDKPDSELRIADIYERTGLSSSVIYSYFRSRDGLIDAAYIELSKEMSKATELNLAAIFNPLKKPDDVSELFALMSSDPKFQQEWQQNRAIRLRIAARAMSSSRFMHKYKPIAKVHLEKLEKQIEFLQSKNFVNKKFSPEQAVHIFEGVLMALTVKEGISGEADYLSWFSTMSGLLVINNNQIRLLLFLK